MGMLRSRWDPINASNRFNRLLNSEVVAALREKAPPTGPSAAVPYVPPGKQLQIHSIVRHTLGGAPVFRDADGIEHTSPLLSQPLVEVCLSIPTYILVRQGWDRAVAREAFKGCVPQEILRRRSKGFQENYTSEVFRRNRGFVRELLLDGYLMRENLLHRERLESALSTVPSGAVLGMREISRLLETEIWLQVCARHRGRICSDEPEPAVTPPRQLAQA
jgi:Asparagine synthase